MIKFIGMVPGRFEIENIARTWHGDDNLHKVMIHKLYMKQLRFCACSVIQTSPKWADDVLSWSTYIIMIIAYAW
jgi:hypothetical protein